MIDTPQIVETAVQDAAVIHLTIPARAMPSHFSPAVGELLTTLSAQGIEPIGAIFAHHVAMPSATFDFELGIKVASPVQPAGRVRPGQLPRVKAARTIYTGPYEGLSDAWEEFNAWLKSNGHKGAPSLWELYSVGPQATPDQTQWRTELNRPLAS